MKILIRPHDVGKGTADFLGREIHKLGFDGAQLAIAKAIEGQNGNPGTLTPDLISEIRSGFNDNGVEIPILGAYFNPVHSNKEKAKAGAEKYADHLRHAAEFGARFVSSESGSYNDDHWTYNPKNQTEEAFQEVKAVFAPMPKIAEESGVTMVIEGAWGHCMFCPDQLKRLMDEITDGGASGSMKVIVDTYNYLYIGNYADREKIFAHALDVFKGKIAAFHLKDFVVDGEELKIVPLGDGIMGWQDFLPEIKNHIPEALLVFEGVPEPEKSLEFVRKYVG